MGAARGSTEAGGGTGSDGIHRFVRAGLEVAGIEASEDEIVVMVGAHGLYSPLIEALLTAELGGIEPEPGIDVSGPPR
jgi:hypothetical protein